MPAAQLRAHSTIYCAWLHICTLYWTASTVSLALSNTYCRSLGLAPDPIAVNATEYAAFYNQHCGEIQLSSLATIAPGYLTCCSPGTASPAAPPAAQLLQGSELSNIVLSTMNPAATKAYSMLSKVNMGGNMYIVNVNLENGTMPSVFENFVMQPAVWLFFAHNVNMTGMAAGALAGVSTGSGLGTGIFIRDNPNLNGAQLPAALFNNIMLGSLGILHNPNLNTLPSDLFQGLQMAANSTLYLQGNGLTFLPPDLFEGLPLSYVRHVTLFDNNFSRASNFPSFGSGIYIGACESGVLNSDVITSTDEFGFAPTNVSADGDVLFFSPLLLDLSNTGSWMENAAFEHIFTSLPDPVQISLGNSQAQETVIGCCCMNLDLAQNGDQRYLWAEGVLKCSVGTTLFDLSDFADQSVAEAHCYCMNRTAIAEFNTVFDTAVQTVDGVFDNFRIWAEHCHTFADVVRLADGTCATGLDSCGEGYRKDLVGQLPSLPCAAVNSDIASQLGLTTYSNRTHSLVALREYACQECLVPHCGACTSSASSCSRCATGYKLQSPALANAASNIIHYSQYINTQIQCFENCPSGYYVELKTLSTAPGDNSAQNGLPVHVCLECSSNCVACANASWCWACDSGLFLENGQCLESCGSETQAPSTDDRNCSGSIDAVALAVSLGCPNASNGLCNTSSVGLPCMSISNGVVGNTCVANAASAPSSGGISNGGVAAIVVCLFLIAIVGIFAWWRYSQDRKTAVKLMHELDLTATLLDERSGEVEMMRSAWQIDPDDVQLKQILDAGAFGEVWAGTWSDVAVAVKMPKTQDGGGTSLVMDSFAAVEFEKEAQFVCQIRHVNVIACYGIGVFPTSNRPFIVMELMSRGNLRTLLQCCSKKEDGRCDEHGRELPLSWDGRYSAAIDIARGMKYLHNRDCLHRDLKSANCLINEQGVVKVGDFGSSRVVLSMLKGADAESTHEVLSEWGNANALTMETSMGNSSNDRAKECMTKGIGTLLWMSPEVLEGSAQYGIESDVFSYAMVLYELVTRQVPWGHITGEGLTFMKNLRNAMTSGDRPVLPDSCEPGFRNLIHKCWSQKRSSRPTFRAILNDPAIMARTREPDHAPYTPPNRSSTTTRRGTAGSKTSRLKQQSLHPRKIHTQHSNRSANADNTSESVPLVDTVPPEW